VQYPQYLHQLVSLPEGRATCLDTATDWLYTEDRKMIRHINICRAGLLLAVAMIAGVAQSAAEPIRLNAHDLDTVTAGTSAAASAQADARGWSTLTAANTATLAAQLSAGAGAFAYAEGDLSASATSQVLLTAQETATLLAALAIAPNGGAAQSLTQVKYRTNARFQIIKLRAKAMAFGVGAETGVVWEAQLPSGTTVRFKSHELDRLNRSVSALRITIRVPMGG
jgi:hypothetical protein